MSKIQLVSTVLDQSHLIPVPLQVRPIFWSFDHALRLYPQSHLVSFFTFTNQLILADKCEPFVVEYEETQAINPGSFANSGSFMVYQPALNDVQPR